VAPGSTAADRARRLGYGAPPRLKLAWLSCAALAIASPAAAGPGDKARISGLSDVAFGSIANFGTDSVRSQSICLYSKSPPADNYRITAAGSGPGGSFLLSSGSDTLPFELQWSDRPGQDTGAQLLANQPLSAQTTAAGTSATDDCSKGPATTASLIVILRSAAISAATSGTYAGTLTLLVAPE
jgi:hypothetical protein